jgi:hypothetical protein
LTPTGSSLLNALGALRLTEIDDPVTTEAILYARKINYMSLWGPMRENSLSDNSFSGDFLMLGPNVFYFFCFDTSPIDKAKMEIVIISETSSIQSAYITW